MGSHQSQFLEANLARKGSNARDPRSAPEVVEGKVYRRDTSQAGAQTGQAGAQRADGNADSTETSDVPFSPAAERASDAAVQRATRGLMRLDSRRRFRATFRRLTVILVVLSVVGGLAFYVHEDVTAWIDAYWQMMREKIELSSESASRGG